MSKFRSVRLAGAIALTAPLAALASLSPAPALAVGCHGSGCNGQSPGAMGCTADAVSVNHVVFEDHASGGTFGRQVVTLRYSRRCNASWSRVNANAGGTVAVTSSSAYMGGFKASTIRTRAGAGRVASKMRAGSAVSACGRTSFNHGNVIKVQCASAG